MKSTLRPEVGRLAFAIAAAITASAGVAAPATHSDEIVALRSIQLSEQAMPTPVGADGKADFIVILDGEPAAYAYANALRAAGGRGPMALTAAGNASRFAREALQSQQATFTTQLLTRQVSATELYRVQRALNAVALRMAPEDVAKVRAIPGVQRVEFIDHKVPDLSTSAPHIGAPSVWEGTPLGLAGVKGEGISIGIIDSGVDYMHPMFGGTGVLSDYQANNTTVVTEVGAAAFPTARVVGGTDFVGNGYSGGATVPVPDPDPMDCLGHGSHVAGIAAGGGVNADNSPYAGPLLSATNYQALKIGPGVAPRAQVYALRVFGCGGSTGFTAAAIDWATDPNNDGDLSDRLDVINMSLGSAFGLAFDETAAASDNATLSGMIVVASAGNNGDAHNISGSPGSGQHVISTASSLDAGQTAGVLRHNAPAGIAGFRTAGTASFGTTPPAGGLTADIVRIDDGVVGTGGTVNDGCQTPYVNAAAVAGKIAFVDRGGVAGCGFKLKARNAELNGAIGVIIGNIATSASPTVAPGMADDITIPAVNIPTVSLNLADGDEVRNNNPLVNSTLFSGGDTVSSFTSRGGRVVGAQGTYLKPDIAAPGTSITSMQTGVTCTTTAQGCITANASGFIANGAALTISGTSMSAPHTAGVAALVRQLNPSLTADAVKALLVSTAGNDIRTLPNGLGERFSGGRIGAGRTDAARAATADVYAYNDDVPGAVSVLFDDPVVGTTTQAHNVRIVNRTAAPQTVTLSLDTINDSPGVSFAVTSPTTVALAPGGSAVATVTMTAVPGQMDHYLSPTLAATQNAIGLGLYPRAFLSEESALLKISRGANELARVAVYMAHRPHSDMHGTATVAVDAPPIGTVNVALSGTDVCSGTAGPGSCTGDFATDEVSLVSPFELVYTGIENSDSLPGFANVQYFGVNYDAANDLYLFGYKTFGKWQTPTMANLNICLDLDRDGTYDRVLWHANGNNRGLTTSNNAVDVFLNYSYNPSSMPPGAVGILADANVLSPDVVDTALHDNNVQIINFPGAAFSLPAGGGSFNYAVAVCPYFNPICVRIPAATNTVCNTPGATYETFGPFTYNAAARGITSTGGLSFFGGPSLPVLIPDLNGTSLAIDYNQANLTANGAHSILLLHHHNAEAETADVILVIDRVFGDGFEEP